MVRWQISAILGGAAAVAISVAALIAHTSSIRQDLTIRTAQVLAGEATSWASVEISGRDVRLLGAAPSEDSRLLAINRLERVFGVSAVDASGATLLPEVKPYRLDIIRNDDEVGLEGYAPSLPDRARLDAALRGAIAGATYADRLDLARGLPDERFLGVATTMMQAVKRLRFGKVEIIDHSVTLHGEATSNVDYDALIAAPPVLPPPYVLVRSDIVRPVATPFTWSVDLHDGSLSINGYAPDPATRAKLVAAVRSQANGRPLHDGSDLASGAPSGFADIAEAAVDYLDLMAEAHVRLSDRVVTIAGRATTPGAYRTLTAYLETWSPPGFRVQSSIDLPVVTPYTLTASRMGGRITVSGFAPDDTARDIIADAAAGLSSEPAVVELTLADGAPNGFAGAARYALDLLGKCSSGTVIVSDSRIRIDGVATTGGDLIELDAAAANPPDDYGVELKVEPPAVSPYVWQVEKTKDQLILSGSSPSEEVRSAIQDALDNSFPDLAVYDKTSLATGLGDGIDLEAVANASAAVLAHLESGSVTLSDRSVSVKGQASSALERDAALDALGKLPPKLVNGDVAIQASVRVILVIERGLDTVTLDGVYPDEATHQRLLDAIDRSMGAVDLLPSLEPGSDLPSGASGAELLAIRAASALAKGRVTVEDGLIAVSGQTFTGVGATRLATAISADLPSGYRLAASVGAAPAEPEADGPLCEQRIGAILARNGVRFEPGETKPSGDSLGLIDRLGAVALSCPAAHLDVSGVPDMGGAAELGASRAAAIVDALVEIGVDRARLTGTGVASGSMDGRKGMIDIHAVP